MSQVFLISDLHLTHRRVLEFADHYRAKALNVETIQQHDELICDNWNDTVHKRDLVLCLGDLGHGYELVKKLSGHKKVILGNHDLHHASEYLKVFDDIIGARSYKKNWISHFPITPQELFFKNNIHGHTHSQGVNDSRYINVSIEMTLGYPISFQDIKSGKFVTWNRVNQPFGFTGEIVDNNPNIVK